jgi:hypothetical protein
MLQVLKTITHSHTALDCVLRHITVRKAMEFSQEYHTIFFVMPFVIKHIFESLTK